MNNMYNSVTTNSESAFNNEAKYTVADILSSMANGEGFSDPTYSTGAVSAVVTPTSAMTPTSLLTPTTLASLEQTFIELQAVPSEQQQGPLSRQSGFVPPVVDPSRLVKQEHDEYYSEDSCDPDWAPSAKRARLDDGSSSQGSPSRPSGPRRHTGPRPPKRYEKLTIEEESRRGVRRERNKQAAAKCRQRRVDHTNELIQQTEDLEDQKSSLESDIKQLQQQKEQLEFLLDAHKPLCNSGDFRKSSVLIKVEPNEETSDMGCQTMTTTLTRPSSLSLSRPTTSVSSVTQATGIPINTPSSGVFATPSSGVFATLGLDSMVDGHTGLTPITGAPTSCASALQRNHVTDSESSSSSQSLNSPTTLMAL